MVSSILQASKSKFIILYIGDKIYDENYDSPGIIYF